MSASLDTGRVLVKLTIGDAFKMEKQQNDQFKNRMGVFKNKGKDQDVSYSASDDVMNGVVWLGWSSHCRNSQHHAYILL